ncbi:MATE family efflux transporter [Yoonia litorea]|uniref:Multidrug resistance protein, MATE family n=1 Tax=Yoonia litorea TaxID=1123755 RepID=A0A1I6MIM3_9RHOB|nr:MATE family efflux transporter [Yoonia litorea]SFS15534.1 multidrug resistance protein, MATE family [Yoonia litorea]
MANVRNVTHRRVLGIALPIVLSNATVPILGVVDTGVVGQLGEAAPIGAVGIGAIILSAVYWIFGFLRMGTTGLTSQAVGADDTDEVHALLSRALLIGVTAGLVMILGQALIFQGAFWLSPASAEVESLARDYMEIRIWSAPATIALYGITGWLIAQERTKTVLVLQVAMNGGNIILSYMLGLQMGWGISGVAWATFIAEWGGLALGLWFCRHVFAGTAWRTAARIFDLVRLKHMAVVNSDILIRSVLLQAIFVSFLFFGSGFGDVQLAANQILMQFLQVTAYALDGFAFSAEALVGNALGARARATLRRSALLASFWGGVICVGLSICFAIFGPIAIDIMTTAPDVREASRTYLPYMVAAPIVGIAAWMLDGIFIGATRTKDMRNMMIVSAITYFATVVPLMAAFGNHGLWLGLLLNFIVRGLTLAWKYPALEAEADRPRSGPAAAT